METNEIILKAKDLNQQGIMLMKTGNFEEAKEKFEKAIDIEPMLMDTYKNYGDLYLQMEQYQEAKNYYKKALLIKKEGVVYFQYGNACFMSDEPHEGLEYYNLAVSAGYDSDEMFFFMGMAYEHMNDEKMALRYIQKAINKNPSRPDYKVKKVSVLLRMNLMEEAEETVDEILLNDPELYDGYHMKIALLSQRQEYTQAVEFAKKATEKFPEDADLLYDYAKAVAMTGKLDEVLHIIDRAKKMKYYESAKAQMLLLEAEVYAEKGDLDTAILKCNECIQMEDGQFNSQARFMAINLYLVKTDFSSALEHSKIIVQYKENDSFYFAATYFEAFCLRKLGREEEAKVHYKKAISMYRIITLANPEALDAYLYRAMCLRDLEEYEDALEMLDYVEKICNQIAEVYTIRADIYKLTGKTSLVKGELEKAYTLKPELRNILMEDGE